MEDRLLLYLNIYQLKEKKFKVAQIANELMISRTTVCKYLEMDFEEVGEYVTNPHQKKNKLDAYLDWIVAWLEEYPHLSEAQIQDWLLERTGNKNVHHTTKKRPVVSVSPRKATLTICQLRLAETAEELPQLLHETEKASWTYLEFLGSIMAFELAKREARSVERRMK